MRGSIVMRGFGIVGAATAMCLSAGMAQAAPSGGTASPLDSRSGIAVAAPKAQQQAGFVPVRQLTYRPLAGVSPSKGELWLVGSGSSGSATLEHLRNGRWTTEQIPNTGWGGSALVATSRDDVWLTVGGALRHYDGKAWKVVATPTGPDGKPLQAGALATGPGGVLYVGMSAQPWQFRDHLYRYDRGQWTDLGAPAPAGMFGGLVKIAVDGDTISAVVVDQRTRTSYDLVNGAWTRPRQVTFWGGGQTTTFGYYDVTAGGIHLALGGSGFSGLEPHCLSWAPTKDIPCTSTIVTGAGAKLKNGSLILGGDDYTTPMAPPATKPSVRVEGRFVLRGTDGVERPVAGDPGVRTVLMVAEAHQNSAWAVTQPPGGTGTTYTLQYYAG